MLATLIAQPPEYAQIVATAVYNYLCTKLKHFAVKSLACRPDIKKPAELSMNLVLLVKANVLHHVWGSFFLVDSSVIPYALITTEIVINCEAGHCFLSGFILPRRNRIPGLFHD